MSPGRRLVPVNSELAFVLITPLLLLSSSSAACSANSTGSSQPAEQQWLEQAMRHFWGFVRNPRQSKRKEWTGLHLSAVSGWSAVTWAHRGSDEEIHVIDGATEPSISWQPVLHRNPAALGHSLRGKMNVTVELCRLDRHQGSRYLSHTLLRVVWILRSDCKAASSLILCLAAPPSILCSSAFPLLIIPSLLRHPSSSRLIFHFHCFPADPISCFPFSQINKHGCSWAQRKRHRLKWNQGTINCRGPKMWQCFHLVCHSPDLEERFHRQSWRKANSPFLTLFYFISSMSTS